VNIAKTEDWKAAQSLIRRKLSAKTGNMQHTILSRRDRREAQQRSRKLNSFCGAVKKQKGQEVGAKPKGTEGLRASCSWSSSIRWMKTLTFPL
jgi:hypothetical protein